jgi:hypothetical protein
LEPHDGSLAELQMAPLGLRQQLLRSTATRSQPGDKMPPHWLVSFGGVDFR